MFQKIIGKVHTTRLEQRHGRGATEAEVTFFCTLLHRLAFGVRLRHRTHTRRADLVVAALGKPRFVKADMLKSGAIVIDVGINRIADGPDAGKLCGDVDFAAAREVASLITPVPGGVGPMTITMLLANTIESAERAATLKEVE